MSTTLGDLESASLLLRVGDAAAQAPRAIYPEGEDARGFVALMAGKVSRLITEHGVTRADVLRALDKLADDTPTVRFRRPRV